MSVIVCNARWRRPPPVVRRVQRPTLHGGTVWLRPVRATPCLIYVLIGFSYRAKCWRLWWSDAEWTSKPSSSWSVGLSWLLLCVQRKLPWSVFANSLMELKPHIVFESLGSVCHTVNLYQCSLHRHFILWLFSSWVLVGYLLLLDSGGAWCASDAGFKARSERVCLPPWWTER